MDHEEGAKKAAKMAAEAAGDDPKAQKEAGVKASATYLKKVYDLKKIMDMTQKSLDKLGPMDDTMPNKYLKICVERIHAL